jgi:four helix bundle protein
MDRETLKKRTKQFGLCAFSACGALPGTIPGKTIAAQLARSASSVGANYRAACRARSKAESCAKLAIVIEEADESVFWLEMAMEGKLPAESKLAPLLNEANELTAIFVTTRKSAAE